MKFISFTILKRAFRRKNALQDSHEIASKLYPCAKPQQTILEKQKSDIENKYCFCRLH